MKFGARGPREIMDNNGPTERERGRITLADSREREPRLYTMIGGAAIVRGRERESLAHADDVTRETKT